MTHKQKRATGASEAQCQIANYERFGNDLLIAEYGLHTIGKELGSVMGDPEDAVPAIMKHVLDDLDDIDKLDFSRALPENSPDYQKHLECVKILVDKMGQEVPTGVLITGPFTAVSSIYPVEKLLRATRRNPEAIHKLLRACTDVLKELHKGYIEAGAMILFCEPIATGSIINPKEYLDRQALYHRAYGQHPCKQRHGLLSHLRRYEAHHTRDGEDRSRHDIHR